MNFVPQMPLVGTPVATITGRARRARAKALPRDDIRNLPFIRDVPKSEGGGRCFWSVAGTGDYGTDCELGHKLGQDYLAFVGQYHREVDVVLLGWIVEDMIALGLSPGPDFGKGVRIGFLHTVNGYALAAAHLLQNRASKHDAGVTMGVSKAPAFPQADDHGADVGRYGH